MRPVGLGVLLGTPSHSRATAAAAGVQGGLLVYILVVPTAVDPADLQPIVYDHC